MAKGKVLYDIGSCKQELFSSFINDPEICELLFNKKPYTDDDREKLFYSQIFPYLYVGDEENQTQTETLTYLCYEVNVPKFPTSTVKDMKIIVWAYCHKDIMKYSKKGYYGTRADILADMVERKLRDSYDLGIGKPELVSVEHFFPNNKYYGRVLVYNVPEFKVKG
jgi:hypothetical protein